ncbi:osiris 21 [Haematobia irritans]|uniref:osiris 21 n=1 Tax=Haematobia irritans TaxID=7368 RepID=UPI003F4F8CF4
MNNNKRLKYLFFLACCLMTNFHHVHSHQRIHRTATSTNKIPSNTNARASSTTTSSSSWLGPEFQIIRRVYDDCHVTNDFMSCLKQKALNGLGRAIDQDSIKIFDGVILEKQNETEKQSILGVLADARALNNLAPLDRALLSKVDKLVRTHALKVDMSVARYGGEDGGGGGGGGGHGKEGKHKKDKGGGHVKYVVAALLTAMGIAGPIGLKALAAIAGKALVISKVALTIASIIALKKLFSHDHHEETSFQVHAGDHNRRSTYVIRPVPKTAGIPAATGETPVVDPYRYYYEYH